jgi:hypothetical protein
LPVCAIRELKWLLRPKSDPISSALASLGKIESDRKDGPAVFAHCMAA